MNASKGDSIEIKWHELLQRAQTTRSELNKTLFEKKRKAFIEKSVQINDDPVE